MSRPRAFWKTGSTRPSAAPGSCSRQRVTGADAPATIAHSGRDLHIFKIAGLVVDAEPRRRDPAGELARLGHRVHQADNEIAVVLRRQPFADLAVPGRIVDDNACRRYFHVFEFADLAVEADMRQRELERDAGLANRLVPTVDAALAVGGVVVAQPHIDGGERRL